MLTAERLRELLDYDPEAGVFTWKTRSSRNSRVAIGAEAGTRDKESGYILITIDGVKYKAHRLVWLYMTGEWPVAEIDHRFGIESDNRWSEIREATRAENNQNTRLRKDNTSGFKGVTWRGREGKYQARIQVGGKLISLGYFEKAEEASAAYGEAAARHHGEFARTP